MLSRLENKNNHPRIENKVYDKHIHRTDIPSSIIIFAYRRPNEYATLKTTSEATHRAPARDVCLQNPRGDAYRMPEICISLLVGWVTKLPTENERNLFEEKLQDFLVRCRPSNKHVEFTAYIPNGSRLSHWLAGIRR